MKPLEPEATRLALALLSGPFDEAELLRLGRPIVRGKIKWLDQIVNRNDHGQFLLNDKGFRKAAEAENFGMGVGGETPPIRSWINSVTLDVTGEMEHTGRFERLAWR